MKILIFCNIPSPYRVDFFNELGRNTELTVIFEAKSAKGIKFNWNIEQISNFNAIFLKEGDIEEKKINFKILKYIKKDYYDFIFVTNYSYFTEMLALIVLKIRRIPYVLEIDGGLIRKETKWKKWIKSFLISNALAYFSPSDKSDEYLSYYGANSEKIFRYPFTSLKYSDIKISSTIENQKKYLKKELGIIEDKIVLAIGQFIPRKGFDLLIKASKDLNSNVGVYLIGGKENSTYSKLIRDFNIKSIYFKDFMDKSSLEKYFQIADVFVLPTREDIWGLVINEAMSYGLPVISTNNCMAAVELIKEGKNGFIINVDDVKSLSLSINKILDDDYLRQKMSINSLDIIQYYTIENMVDIHLKVLNNLKTKKI